MRFELFRRIRTVAGVLLFLLALQSFGQEGAWEAVSYAGLEGWISRSFPAGRLELETLRKRCGGGLTGYERQELQNSKTAETAVVICYTFRTPDGALQFWQRNAELVNHFLMPRGDKVYEVSSPDLSVVLKLWNALLPDPAIAAVCRLETDGIAFVKVNNMLDPSRSQVASQLDCEVKLLYNTFLSDGDARLIFIEAGEKSSAEAIRAALLKFGDSTENVTVLSPKLVAEFVPRGLSVEQAAAVRKALIRLAAPPAP